MSIAEIILTYRNALLKLYDAAETRAIIQLVFEDTLGLDSLKLEMNKYLLVTTHQQKTLSEILTRLCDHEPVQYVLGKADFMDLKLQVNKHVLIPRPETEDLVRWIINSVGENFDGEILDIGTGSGCIAIALKKHLPHAKLLACDVNQEALTLASQNALQNKVDIDFFLLDVLQHPLHGKYQVIVSNPPYIPLNEKDTLAKHVVDFEPALALFTEADNALIFYERITSLAAEHLHPDGMLFFETHHEKTNEVAQVLQHKGFKQIEQRKDFFDKYRMVAGRV